LKRLLVIALSSIVLLSPSFGWTWDGQWTQAQSGNGADLFDDPGRSQGKAGTSPPQKFWMAGPRDYVDVDPDELVDYFDRRNKDYSPYALARIEQTLHYQGLTLPKGYYLIKPGQLKNGSIKANLETLSEYGPSPQETAQPQEFVSLPPLETDLKTEESEKAGNNKENQSPTIPPAASTTIRPPGLSAKVPVYQTFVIIRQGRVVGVVPIHRMATYLPPKKPKIPRHALAWVEWEDRRPVLKFYYRKWVYETQFQ
jgi:hypothetical protein